MIDEAIRIFIDEEQVKKKISELKKEIAILESALTPEEQQDIKPFVIRRKRRRKIRVPKPIQIPRPKRFQITYKGKHKKFLKQCMKKDLSDVQVIDAFNQKFDTKIPRDSIRLRMMIWKLGYNKYRPKKR
jgi:hypothetical protein